MAINCIWCDLLVVWLGDVLRSGGFMATLCGLLIVLLLCVSLFFVWFIGGCCLRLVYAVGVSGFDLICCEIDLLCSGGCGVPVGFCGVLLS